MSTDSKSVFDFIVRASMTSEWRLVIDIPGTREAYERSKIADIRLIGSEHNLADSMTKIMAPKQLLRVIEMLLVTCYDMGSDTTPGIFLVRIFSGN